jgi:ubiquinone/menaquinone biosynthesis C-methylase UbiE
MKTNLKNPFEVEKLRSELADKGNYKELVKTYESKYPEIKDLNTPKFWDLLNKRKHVSKKSNPIAYDRLKRVADLIEDNSSVLNTGAGSGDLENLMFNKLKMTNLDWHSIDISSKSIKTLQKKFPNANLKVGDIKNIKLKKKFFDYVILMEILEHIKPSETFKALKEVRRVLKSNGTLIVTIPLNEGLELMARQGINPNAHVRVYTTELISAELQISKFKIIQKKFLYAFEKHYDFKTFIASLIPGIRKPNNLILICKKV